MASQMQQLANPNGDDLGLDPSPAGPETESQSVLQKRPRDRDSATNSDDSDEEGEAVQRARRRQEDESNELVLQLDRSGRVPAHPMPWAYEFPDMFDYYMNHTPDFTGLGLYKVTIYTKEFRSSAARSPMAFTIQSLISETARFYNRRSRTQLKKLKGYLFRMINEALMDESRFTSTDLISTISALVLYDMILDPVDGNPAVHRAGLKRLIDLHGGLHRVEPYRTRRMIEFTDYTYSYLYGTPRTLADEATYGTRQPSRADHPIRLAIQPVNSDLPTWRLNNHIMYSYGAPVVYLLVAFEDLHNIAKSLLEQPYRKAPGKAKYEVFQLEGQLTQIGASHAAAQLSPPEFAELDCKRHDQTIECARLCCVVLLAYFKLCYLDWTPRTAQYLDYEIQKLHLSILDPGCVIDLEIRAWALITSTALIEKGPQRERCVSLIGKMCSELGLNAWASVESFLTNVFFCPSLQKESCSRLWVEVYRHQNRLIRERTEADRDR